MLTLQNHVAGTFLHVLSWNLTILAISIAGRILVALSCSRTGVLSITPRVRRVRAPRVVPHARLHRHERGVEDGIHLVLPLLLVQPHADDAPDPAHSLELRLHDVVEHVPHRRVLERDHEQVNRALALEVAPKVVECLVLVRAVPAGGAGGVGADVIALRAAEHAGACAVVAPEGAVLSWYDLHLILFVRGKDGVEALEDVEVVASGGYEEQGDDLVARSNLRVWIEDPLQRVFRNVSIWSSFKELVYGAAAGEAYERVYGVLSSKLSFHSMGFEYVDSLIHSPRTTRGP